jgi:Transposase, Mutator family
MQAEMTDHLGYAKHDQAGNNSGNSRNGKTTKALKGDFGEHRPGHRAGRAHPAFGGPAGGHGGVPFRSRSG